MNNQNKPVGSYGEEIAENYIKNLGYEIMSRNFRCNIGEIDIIARDGNYITFIEVKTRYDKQYGYPREAVTKGKQYKICKVAQFYILKNRIEKLTFRFDVIEVILNKYCNEYTVTLIKNAFQT
ncbi:YraN family protein [Clostridium sp. YIM B02515]|uniref:UPF0102 protein JK636_03965 n=1 Tax=Clostridium rhizosphaerae TaxID=2803861 RepID=A0ABS1T8B4_9CLOT|nr:YraN family protein [Clostridium rhizosphaerae]MBL4934911.1 YraN family protein [Clostridium rhizosphaerae]